MHADISTAVTNLEQAASTEEMVKAAKQIANFGVTDHTPEQLNRHIQREITSDSYFLCDPEGKRDMEESSE